MNEEGQLRIVEIQWTLVQSTPAAKLIFRLDFGEKKILLYGKQFSDKILKQFEDSQIILWN